MGTGNQRENPGKKEVMAGKERTQKNVRREINFPT
jgi:hypothetical protein